MEEKIASQETIDYVKDKINRRCGYQEHRSTARTITKSQKVYRCHQRGFQIMVK